MTGLVFLMMGAWPVMGFFGLDVLIIYIAFKLNYRAGKAYELIEVTPEVLRLTQVDPWGRVAFSSSTPIGFVFTPASTTMAASSSRSSRTAIRCRSVSI